MKQLTIHYSLLFSIIVSHFSIVNATVDVEKIMSVQTILETTIPQILTQTQEQLPVMQAIIDDITQGSIQSFSSINPALLDYTEILKSYKEGFEALKPAMEWAVANIQIDTLPLEKQTFVKKAQTIVKERLNEYTKVTSLLEQLQQHALIQKYQPILHTLIQQHAQRSEKEIVIAKLHELKKTIEEKIQTIQQKQLRTMITNGLAEAVQVMQNPDKTPSLIPILKGAGAIRQLALNCAQIIDCATNFIITLDGAQSFLATSINAPSNYSSLPATILYILRSLNVEARSIQTVLKYLALESAYALSALDQTSYTTKKTDLETQLNGFTQERTVLATEASVASLPHKKNGPMQQKKTTTTPQSTSTTSSPFTESDIEKLAHTLTQIEQQEPEAGIDLINEDIDELNFEEINNDIALFEKLLTCRSLKEVTTVIQEKTTPEDLLEVQHYITQKRQLNLNEAAILQKLRTKFSKEKNALIQVKKLKELLIQQKNAPEQKPAVPVVINQNKQSINSTNKRNRYAARRNNKRVGKPHLA